VRWVLRISELWFLTIFIAFSAAFMNPSGLLGVDSELIRFSEASHWNEVLWVDARSSEEFQKSRIPGAVLLNEENWNSGLDRFMLEWEPGMKIVVYCNSKECGASSSVAQRLRAELAIQHIYVLEGGWPEWLAHQK
tara:strand:+ start:769 stop:1176 length:408 start_codon:yes stop_codon:yes gene_type:complete